MKIALVEDDSAVVEVLKEMLDQQGHEVESCYQRGEDFLDEVRGSAADAVLMDVELAGTMNGIETVRHMSDITDIPVVFITGTEDPDLQEQLNTFSHPALQKPLDPDTLDEALDEALASSAGSAASRTLRLVYLEDDPGDARLVERICESVDCWEILFYHAQNLEEGLDLLQNHSVDLLLLDYFLQEKKAPEVIEELQSEGVEVPILVLTGMGSEEVAADVLRVGAHDYRAKEDLSTGFLVQSIQYVLEKYQEEQTLQKRANHDSLTDLLTRQYFMERLNEHLERAVQYDERLTFLLVDLDHFKSINDEHGHRAGDFVLQKISQFIQETIRDTDFAGRYGGDEIGIILPQTGAQGGIRLSKRILNTVNTHRFNPPHSDPFKGSVSLGLADMDGSDFQVAREHLADTLLEKADQALYEAKAQGRGTVVQHSSA